MAHRGDALMRLRCGDEVFDVLVREQGGALEVRVGEREVRFQLDTAAPGVFVVRDGRRSRTLHVARDGAAIHVHWDGATFLLAEEREGRPSAPRPLAGALEAPMPGRVSAVRVAPGQRVARGEELVVVEAMKMENALRAPRDGTVRAVHVAAGDAVAPGRVLVEIE